jgi:hypothetical protein
MRLEGNRLIWEAPDVSKDTSFLVELMVRDERGGESSNTFELTVSKSEMQ